MIELSVWNLLFFFGTTVLSSSVVAAIVSNEMTNRVERKKFYREKLEECVYFNTLYNKNSSNCLFAYSGATSGLLTTSDDFYEALRIQSEGDTTEAWPKLHATARLYFKELHEVIDGYEQLQRDFADFEILIEKYFLGEQKPSEEDHKRVMETFNKLKQLKVKFLHISQGLIKKYEP